MFEMREIKRFVPTAEQEAIFGAIKNGEEHVLVEALAGTGKTETNKQALLKMLGKIAKGMKCAFCAFNKSVAVELSGKVPRGVWTGTTHSLGYKILRDNLERCKVDRDKTWDIITELRSEFLEGRYWRNGERPGLRQLVSLLKQVGFRPQNAGDYRDYEGEMEEVVEKYDIAWPGDKKTFFLYAFEVLRVCMRRTDTVDFDDQIWLPYVLDMECPRYDLLMVDEAQDLNPVQHELTMRSGERLVVVGDRHQSIYGFRGADPDSIPKYQKLLSETKRGLVVLPLTTCWRCPREVISVAQMLVPDIKCKKDAELGLMEVVNFEEMYEGVSAGDMVLCRTNLPLVRLLYRLWKDLRPAYIQGRDVADGLKRLVEIFEDRTDEVSLARLNRWLDMYEIGEREKLESRKGSSSAIAALEDKCDCLRVMIDYTPNREGVEGLKRHMDALFQEDGNPEKQIRLSSVHRAKGLEADNVYVLEPGLMPHYLCKMPWELEQEKNIAYVAFTRAKKRLFFVGGYPMILEGLNGVYAQVPARGEQTHEDAGAIDAMVEDSLARRSELLCGEQEDGE